MSKIKSQQFWIDHFKIFDSSGLSQANYCRQNNLKLSTFYSKKSLLKIDPGIKENFAKLMIPLKSTDQSFFSIKINGHELSFPEIPSPEWMASFINNLELSNDHR